MDILKLGITATVISTMMFTSSCVSKKKFLELESRLNQTTQSRDAVNKSLNTCETDKAAALARVHVMEDQMKDYKRNNEALIQNMGNLTTLTSKGAENLEKSLESLKEKDTKITRLQDAITRKDSVTLAIVTSLKGALAGNDEGIEINVDKGVVLISISDKMLFKSGSYTVTEKAKDVLRNVAKVVNGKPDFEVMVESHTDNVPVASSIDIKDNWDLSVKRSTSIVRILQLDYKVAPERIIASGRSEYMPVTNNDTVENRGKNRRTRILVMPKLDQFYNMVEEGMKNAPK